LKSIAWVRFACLAKRFFLLLQAEQHQVVVVIAALRVVDVVVRVEIAQRRDSNQFDGLNFVV
jgi:hypothetical protein